MLVEMVVASMSAVARPMPMPPRTLAVLVVMELRAMVAWAPRDKMPPAMAAELPVMAVSMTLSGPAMMVAMPPPQPVVVLSVMVEPSTVVVPMENRPPPLVGVVGGTVAFVSETVPTVEPTAPPKMTCWRWR
ncbi:MAG: hypothetical protein R2690_07885 [Acidimicrobiales bacterium]